MSEDLINDPNWKKKAPFGLHTDGTPITKEEHQTQKSVKFNVTVDSAPLENAMKKQAEAEARAQSVEEKLEAVLDKQADKLLDEAGITDEEKRFELKANPEMLDGYIQGLKDAKPKGTGGSALTPEQLAGASQKQGYDSQEEMVDALNDMAKYSDNPAQKEYAKAVLEKMTEKWARGMKEQPHQLKYEDPDWFKKLQAQKRKEEMKKRKIDPDKVEYEPSTHNRGIK